MQTADILGGVFMLILLYLLLANSTALNNVVNALATQGEQNIRALQGRS